MPQRRAKDNHSVIAPRAQARADAHVVHTPAVRPPPQVPPPLPRRLPVARRFQLDQYNASGTKDDPIIIDNDDARLFWVRPGRVEIAYHQDASSDF